MVSQSEVPDALNGTAGAAYPLQLQQPQDLVFIGSMDGIIEAVNAESGEVLWKHDTWQQYTTINGVEAVGGAIDAHGPMLVDDLLIVSSGYGSYDQKPGNALLVFQLPEDDQ